MTSSNPASTQPASPRTSCQVCTLGNNGSQILFVATQELWEGLLAISKHLGGSVVPSLICRDAKILMAHTSFFYKYLAELKQCLDSKQTSNFLMQPLPNAEMLKHEIERNPFAKQTQTQAENKHRLLKGLVRHIGHMPKECKLEAIQQQFENHLLICAEEKIFARLEEAELKVLQAVFPEPNGDRPYTLDPELSFAIAKALCHKQFAENKIYSTGIPMRFRDKTFYHLLVAKQGYELRSVPDAMLDETIITIALGQNGDALQFVPENQRTEELCLAALQNGGYPLWFVPIHFKRSLSFLLKAYDQNPGITEEMDGQTHALLLAAVSARATQQAGQFAVKWLKGLTRP